MKIQKRTHSIRRLRLFIPMLVLVLFGCSEGGVFMPNVEPSKDIEIITAEPGLSFSPDGKLRVNVVSNQPSRSLSEEGFVLDVRLFDAAQTELSFLEFNEVDDLPDIGLPFDIAPGFYEMRYRLYQNERLVISHVQAFFVHTSDIFLNGISVYPSILEPDSQGIMRADVMLDSPGDDQQSSGALDPYLVWRLDSAVVHRGLLREGADEIRIRSPQREGNYSVQVDVYPFPPEEETTYSFRSPWRLDPAPRVTVLKDPKPRAYELQPVDSYYTLLRMNGNLRDIGQRMKQSEEQFRAEFGAEPKLLMYDDRLGHELTGTDQLYADAYVLPTGYLAPFTLTFRGRFTAVSDEDADEVWLHASHSSWSVVLSSDSNLIEAEIGGNAPVRFTAPRQIIPDDQPVQWSFSYLVEAGVAFGMWTVNGMLLHVDSVDLPDGFVPDDSAGEPGRILRPVSRLGGGIEGILEEFGVFYRVEEVPSIDTGSFRRAMELLYPHTLIFADSFTGSLDLLEDYQLSDEVNVGGGYLHIPAGATARLPSVFFRNTDIILELLFAEEPEDDASYLLLQASNDAELIRSYEVSLVQELQVLVSREGQVYLYQRADSTQEAEEPHAVALTAMDAPADTDFIPESFSLSAIVVNNSGEDAVLRLQHALARHSSSSGIDDIFD